MSQRRGGALLAGLLAGLAACAESDRVAYIALVGEAPGDRPLYTGLSPSVRLARTNPGIPEASYRPPSLPDEPTGRAADVARVARQDLSDRASDFELRVRYLRLNASEYLAPATLLRPNVGEPLPPPDARTLARITAARQAMVRMQADVLSIHGILQRADQSKAQAERALALVRAAGPAAAPLVQPLSEGIAGIERMMRAGEALVARYVEWLADQRTALDALEEEIRSGVAAGPGILTRPTIIP